MVAKVAAAARAVAAAARAVAANAATRTHLSARRRRAAAAVGVASAAACGSGLCRGVESDRELCENANLSVPLGPGGKGHPDHTYYHHVFIAVTTRFRRTPCVIRLPADASGRTGSSCHIDTRCGAETPGACYRSRRECGWCVLQAFHG